MKLSDIAVVGLSCYYPGSKSPKEFWHNILSKRQQFRNMPNCRLPLQDYWHPDKKHPDTTYGKKAALIDGYEFDWRGRKITKTSFESTDLVHWLALDVALDALNDAGVDHLNNDYKDSTGVVVGNTLTGEIMRSETMRLRWPFVKKVLRQTASRFDWSDDKIDDFEKEMEVLYKSVFATVTEDSLAGGLANTIAGRICNFCDFHGGGYIVDGACSSSILSIATAANHLASGEMDVVVAGGVDISLDTFELIGFAKAGALTQKEMKVYDENRTGFVPGEGCGMVVLKRLEDAKKDGNKIYATINGWGISSDGKGGITAPSDVGQSRALIRAYEKSDIKPENLNFIEGHGTGTFVGDATELKAIKLTFDNFAKNHQQNCAMTSLKSIMGHTKAAAGVGAFIKSVIALNQRVVPPTAGVDTPNSLFGQDNFPLYPAISAKKFNKDVTLHAGVSAMGFGGINSHVVLSSGDEPFEEFKTEIAEEKMSFSTQDSEVFVYSSQNQDSMLEDLKMAQEEVSGISYSEIIDYAKLTSDRLPRKGAYKCAIVAKNPDDLNINIAEAIRYLESNVVEEGDIFSSEEFSFVIGNDVKKSNIAFLFPGQGSQRLNSCINILNKFDWSKELLKKLDKISNKKVGYNISDKISYDVEKVVDDADKKELMKALSESNIAQPAIVLSSLIWLNFLKKIGINPDVVGGHSLGELVALHEAGAYSEDKLLELSVVRGFEMNNTKSKGSMVSLSCSKDEAKKVIGKIKDLEIANLNSDNQTIISGSIKAIELAKKSAEDLGITAYQLPVSNAFHSKFMNGAADNFSKKMNITNSNFAFSNSDKLFVSSKLGKKVDAKLNLKEHLKTQITGPVNFIDMVKEISKISDFVIEVGPGEVLSRLVNNITSGDLLCCSVEKAAGQYFELNKVIANSFIRNVDINWDALYENRFTLPFTSPAKLDFVVNPLEKDLDGSAVVNKFNNVEEYQLVSNDNQKNDSEVIEKEEFSTVENLLVKVAAKKTGFDEDSISLQHRILDDLNLDSIKSGEFIGEVVRTLNIKGINVTKYANSKLEDVATDLKQYLEENPHVSDDRATNTNNWVRTFVIQYRKDFLQSNHEALKGKKLVFASFGDTKLSNEFIINAKNLGINIKSCDLTKKINIAKGSNLIIEIPKEELSCSGLSVKSRVEEIAKLKDISFDNLESLSVIHFNSEVKSLFASISLENPALKVRLINIINNFSVETLVGVVGSNLSEEGSYITRKYSKKYQYTPFTRPTYNSRKFANANFTKRDNILVSAGAKGITKECVMSWAKGKNARLILLGRSVKKSEEVQKSLQDFADNDISCSYYSCDVVDEKSVKRVINAVTKKFGKITAVIHGAGLNVPRLFHDVDSSEAFKEVSPKVLGLANILNNLNPKDIKMITAMSSIIGYSGMHGNSWYAWSNETIERMLDEYKERSPKMRICTLGYSVWEGVGMGERMDSVSFLGNIGVKAVSKEEGVNNFIRLVDNDCGSDHYIVASKLGSLETWNRNILSKPESNRFLQNIVEFEPEVELISRVHLTLEDDLYVKDHDFQGSFLFPTVFGIEAMGQAVAYLKGLEEMNFPMEIQDLNLKKPIVVDENSGKTIQIVATAKGLTEVEVAISTEDTGFEEKYFYATFHLKGKKSNDKIFEYSKKKVPLDPKEDLYGGILFQGPLYQKLKSIRSLTDDEVICEIDPKFDPKLSKCNDYFSDKFSNKLIMGNPFVRDVLLQSVQLCNSNRILLPVSIDKISLYSNSKFSKLFSKTDVFEKDNIGNAKSDVVLVGDNKKVVEELHGYSTDLVGKEIKENFSAKDLIDPSHYDSVILNKNMADFLDKRDFGIPVIDLKYVNNFIEIEKKDRRDIEKLWFKTIVNSMISGNNDKPIPSFDIKWNQKGKPLVKIDKDSEFEKNINISLSHDNNVCLLSCDYNIQGCDVETISSRNIQEWESLLFGYEKIFKELSDIINLDVAGTIIWSVVESIKKTSEFADDNFTLVLDETGNDGFIFKAFHDNKSIFVSAFKFKGSRTKDRIFSFVVSKKNLDRSANDNNVSGIVKDLFSCKRRGTRDEEIYVHRFRTTFKDGNNVDKTLHHPIFAFWMGKLRELPLQSVSLDLVNDMESGKYGMVTNSSVIKIVGTARSFDLIEGHFWVDKWYGSKNSTVDLCFKWHKVLEDGSLEVIAYSFLPTTWVKVISHGVVEVAPFPKYFSDWLSKIVAKESKDSDGFLQRIEKHKTKFDFGNLIHEDKRPSESQNSCFDAKYSTTLSESNLVGNVYYAHYYEWQARTFDKFVYKSIPDFYQNNDGKQFICTDTRIQHLREAMPFDEIEVKLYVSEIFENALKLKCDFFSFNSSGVSEKLASGYQDLVFVKKVGEDYEACEIPNIIVTNLKTPNKIVPILNINKKISY